MGDNGQGGQWLRLNGHFLVCQIPRTATLYLDTIHLALAGLRLDLWPWLENNTRKFGLISEGNAKLLRARMVKWTK